MTKIGKREYERDHFIGKFIVATIVASLITAAQMVEFPVSLFLNILAVYVWFFGINPVCHLLELALGHRSKHGWW